MLSRFKIKHCPDIDQGFANRGSQYSISSRNAPTSIVREPGLPAADRRMGAEYDDYGDYYYYDDYTQEHKDTKTNQTMKL